MTMCYGFTVAAVVDQSHVCMFFLFLLTDWITVVIASNTSLDRESRTFILKHSSLKQFSVGLSTEEPTSVL